MLKSASIEKNNTEHCGVRQTNSALGANAVQKLPVVPNRHQGVCNNRAAGCNSRNAYAREGGVSAAHQSCKQNFELTVSCRCA